MLDSPLKVLIVIASTQRRGAEIEGSRLAVELQRLGVDASCVALADADGSTVDVPILGATPLGARTIRSLRHEAVDVDVVVAYGSTTLPACALALFRSGVPFVYRSIGDPGAWVRGGWHRRRTSLMMRRAAHVVALWPGASAAIGRLYGVPAQQRSVIPNARSASEFRHASKAERAAARADLGLKPNDYAVAAIGAIAPEKRLDVAVDAVAQIDDAVLLVVGDGPGRVQVEAHASSVLGDRCRMVGSLTDVMPIYAATDVVLSTSRTEGMSGVLIEAGLCGVPIVATDVGAVRWLMKNGASGRLVPSTEGPRSFARELDAARAIDVCEGSELGKVVDWNPVVTSWCAVLHAVAGLSVPEGQASDRPAESPSLKRSLVRALGSTPVAATARRLQPGLRVIAYHGVSNPDRFADQLDLVLSAHHPVSGADVVRAIRSGRALPDNAVWITFDDGHADVVTNARPLLTERSIPATLFVCPGLVTESGAPWWDTVESALTQGWSPPTGSPAGLVTRLKSVDDAERRRHVEDASAWLDVRGIAPAHAAGEQALRTWMASGLELGNHTWDHPCLDRCEPDEQRRQIERGDAWLSSFGAFDEVRLFAYPNGDWTQASEDTLEDLRYDVALLFDHRVNGPPGNHALRMSRLRLDSGADIRRARAVVSGAHSALFVRRPQR